MREGVDVLVCHPRLVATGLDLVDFPTILWAQAGYSLFEVRQASRRSWRLGQTDPVKVVFFAYEGTAQEACLQILGETLLAAQAVEGRFSAEGLQAMGTGKNPALTLAHALVYGLDGLVELTDVWKAADGPGLPALEATLAPASLEPVLVARGPAPRLRLPEAAPLPAIAPFAKIRHSRRPLPGQQTLF